MSLPVEEAIPELLQAMADRSAAVLEAPPGAGKTTLVPLALLRSFPDAGRILMLEPRRLAALNAARRMASLLGEEVGETVGYAVRFERCVSQRTRIEVVTEGILTRRLQNDPSLEGVGIVIFDEFHERNLNSDLALALCREAQTALRPDLKIVVMSATLDVEPVAGLLDAAVVRSGGKLFPVEIRYLDRDPAERIAETAARGTMNALGAAGGDVLVFLPGYAEIVRCLALLREHVDEHVMLCPLYGDLPLPEQDRAIRPAGRRKVVLATDIAETSLTIEGVRTVVDSGWCRKPRFDASSGLSRLETARISRASADQRAGRAGRLAPGVCYRLWTPHTQRHLVPHSPPEIREADLSQLALELAAWGAGEGTDLCWLDPPAAAPMAEARRLLALLGALDGGGRITPLGKRIVSLGVHPRLGSLIAAGIDKGWGGLACDLAAVLAERDPFRRGEGRPLTDNDILDRVEAVEGMRRGAPLPPWGDPGACAAASRLASYLRKQARIDRGERARSEDAALLLAAAYPDRIAGRRSAEGRRYLLSSGKGAELSPRSAVRAAEFLVAPVVDDGGQGEGRIHAAAVISAAALRETFGSAITRERRILWDEQALRVVARDEERLGFLALSVRPVVPTDDESLPLLLKEISSRGLQSLRWSGETSSFVDRVRFLRGACGGDWPDLSDEFLRENLMEWLAPFLQGVRSLEAAAAVDLLPALRSLLPFGLRSRLDAGAPTHLTVPSGSRIRISYESGEPVLAVKLQELFGLGETPRIAWGKVPLTLHLLSPAGRPMQVTRDLKGFWNGSYAEVRKELRGRYPKHPWPEDPWSAQPTRHAKRRQ